MISFFYLHLKQKQSASVMKVNKSKQVNLGYDYVRARQTASSLKY